MENVVMTVNCKKIIKIIRNIALLAVMTGAFYIFFVPSEEKKIEIIFNQRLEEKIAAGEEKIYLKDLVDFEWDSAFLITARYHKKDLEKVFNKTILPDIKENNCDPEQRADVAFINANEAIINRLSFCRIETNCSSTELLWVYRCSRNSFFQVRERTNGFGLVRLKRSF